MVPEAPSQVEHHLHENDTPWQPQKTRPFRNPSRATQIIRPPTHFPHTTHPSGMFQWRHTWWQCVPVCDEGRWAVTGYVARQNVKISSPQMAAYSAPVIPFKMRPIPIPPHTDSMGNSTALPAVTRARQAGNGVGKSPFLGRALQRVSHTCEQTHTTKPAALVEGQVTFCPSNGAPSRSRSQDSGRQNLKCHVFFNPYKVAAPTANFFIAFLIDLEMLRTRRGSNTHKAFPISQTN